MVHRIGRKKFRVFAYDVESHNDPISVAEKKTGIWLSSFIDENSDEKDNAIYFYTIEVFLDHLEKEASLPIIHGKKPIRNIAVYIYNLSFEWSFILPVILKRGFHWKEIIDWKKDRYCYSSITNKTASSVWSVSLKFGPRSGNVIFRDLCKIFPGGLGKIAKSFNLPTQKGEIEYTKNRRSKDYIPTEEEKFYNFKDNRIIIDILLKLMDDKEFWKATSAASYSMAKLLKYAYPKSHHPLKSYRRSYPMLGIDENSFVRKSVGGGITYATPSYQFKELRNLGHIDAHQMHPSQIVSHLFPYGKGEYFEGKPKYRSARRYCLHILVSYSGVYLHSVIKLIGTDIASNAELYVWDFEIPTMKKCYRDLDIKYIDGYAYKIKSVPWAGFCRENYALRKKAKSIKDSFGIMYYKLLNNSGAYGKFLEKAHNECFENIVAPNGSVDSLVHARTPRESDVAESVCNSTYTYLPYGSCIPAWSRVTLIETALKFGWENIVYFDTDSIFFVKNEKTLKTLETLDTRDELCCWGVENDIETGEFTAPKRYKLIEIEKDGTTRDQITMAGVNFEKGTTPTYENTDIIDHVYTVHRMKKVKGGSVLITEPKHIRVKKEYETILKTNTK